MTEGWLGSEYNPTRIESVAIHFEKLWRDSSDDQRGIIGWPLAAACVKVAEVLANSVRAREQIGAFLAAMTRIAREGGCSEVPNGERVPFLFVQFCLLALIAEQNDIAAIGKRTLIEVAKEWTGQPKCAAQLMAVSASLWCLRVGAEAIGVDLGTYAWPPAEMQTELRTKVEARGEQLISAIREGIEETGSARHMALRLNPFDWELRAVDPRPLLSKLIARGT
jgi:hypothetical protein